VESDRTRQEAERLTSDLKFFKHMFSIDIHLDLSMNAMEWNRDLRLPVADINARERGRTDLPGRGGVTVSFPEMRKGRTGFVVATQIARYVAPDNPLSGWYSPEQAWAHTQGQLAWYRAMEEVGEMTMIADLEGFERNLSRWSEETDGHDQIPIGYMLSLEGADSLVTLQHLEKAYAYGLRAVGPAHYGPGRYANGTDSSGRMGQEGISLLREMDNLHMILDVTHLCDDAFWQALDVFKGPIWASHNNCRSIVDHNRQFSDEQLKALIERGAIIGAAMDAWMIVPGWKKKISDPVGMNCSLEKLIDHMDHICQMAGDASHICIGSDLDGGFGKEQCPYDISTIADLRKFPELLSARGYAEDDVISVMHGNVTAFLRKAWS
jgi:membrane dipeptidase